MPDTVVSILARAKRPIDTLEPLVNILAAALAVDPLLVAHYAKLLRRAELLPERDGEIQPLHAARLLISLLGSHRPIDAPAVALGYEDLPVSSVYPHQPREQTDRIAIAGLGTFAEAVARIVAGPEHSLGPSGFSIEKIAVSRDLNRPSATILWTRAPLAWMCGETEKARATIVCYARSVATQTGPKHMSVSASCSDLVLRRLGDLFAGRALGAVAPADPLAEGAAVHRLITNHSGPTAA